MKMESERRALDKIFKRRDRYQIPEWQREEVWPEEKQQLLIDSILRGWKLPKFYFAKTSDSPEEFEVVDGQQRLVAIFAFLEGNLSLRPGSEHTYGGITYLALRDDVVDAFDDYEIEFDVITHASEKELKEFFQRLQGGLPLTASEKLNAVHGKLTDFVRTLAKHAFFKDKVWVGDVRKAHFDIVSKVAAIQIDGIQTGLRYDDLKATFEANAHFAVTSNLGKRLRATFDYLNRVYQAKDPSLRNRSTIQSFATLASKIIETDRADSTERPLYRFFDHFSRELAKQVELGQNATDGDYLEFQRTLSANVKAGAKIRHQILLRKLLANDPVLAAVLGPEAVAESGLGAEIKRLAESIGSLISGINDRYSATNGKDLFKATNKTASALTSIAKTARDFDGYKSFVGDLYFLFWEGSGQRLSGNVPKSFEDVNSLRTALQHDVDHGKPQDVARKKRRLGQVFKAYSGELAPVTLAPERFAVVQANILRALEADLGALVWK
jgi:hypothetical protein